MARRPELRPLVALQYDRLDARQVEEIGDHQADRPCADDRDFRRPPLISPCSDIFWPSRRLDVAIYQSNRLKVKLKISVILNEAFMARIDARRRVEIGVERRAKSCAQAVGRRAH